MEAASLQQLTERLAVSDPALGEALLGRGVQVAVNQQLVREDVILQPGAEVAYLPPMSGG
jgi:molybdopterin synthase sulfur carrier subunit